MPMKSGEKVTRVRKSVSQREVRRLKRELRDCQQMLDVRDKALAQQATIAEKARKTADAAIEQLQSLNDELDRKITVLEARNEQLHQHVSAYREGILEQEEGKRIAIQQRERNSFLLELATDHALWLRERVGRLEKAAADKGKASEKDK